LIVPNQAATHGLPFYIFSTQVNGTSFGYQAFNYDRYTPPHTPYLDNIKWCTVGTYEGPDFTLLPSVITSIPKNKWTACLFWGEGGLGGGWDTYLFITDISRTVVEPSINILPVPATSKGTMYRWKEYIVINNWSTNMNNTIPTSSVVNNYTVPVEDVDRNATGDQLYRPGSKYVPFYLFSNRINHSYSFAFQDYNYDSYRPPYTPFFDSISWYSLGSWYKNLNYGELPAFIQSIPKNQWTALLISANGGLGGGEYVYLLMTGFTTENL